VKTYNILRQSEGSTFGAIWAAEFIQFVGSVEGQKIIENYGKDQYGEGIYNDAACAKKCDE
jgi:tungstate transport system substrate-binding protein